MSTTIDQRVVEMRFDNQQFEKATHTSMSTLAKLKQSLNLTGASKGLENISSAAKKVDMTGLGNTVDTVKMKFSALEVMGVTALANITNSAVNAGKKIVSALTIDPIKTGFSEYETKMNAIQVIQANTRGKNTMDDITAALDELNTYADKTIYNFAQMTSNIGKFTAQGFNVQAATNAVKGLANLAAASGASAEDMARATYQMSQALGSTIKLMDWNSLRNANMATVELKNTLIDLAKVNGIAIDDMIAKHGSFEQTLSEGWLSGEMFTEAMNIYSGVYSDAELKAKGFTDSQIANFKDLAATAESAATEVKTFSQLWDVLKETAQSGWTQTWEILIGDFVTAKDMFTKIQVAVSDVINKFSDARNNLLKGALTSKWDQLAETIEKAGLSTSDFEAKVKEVAKENGIAIDDLVKKYGSLKKVIAAGKIPANILTKALKRLLGSEEKLTDATGKMSEKMEKYGEIVDKVIRGDFGNGQKRIEKLTEAGYDYVTVQNLVNEKLGSSVRHVSKLTESQKENADQLSKLSDETLKNKGYTEEQIEALRELKKAADEGGTSINDLIADIEKPSGRTLLIESFKNVMEALASIVGAVGDAWNDTFGKTLTSDALYRIIEKIHDFTETLGASEDSVKNFKTICEGLFAAFQIGNSLFSMSFTAGLKILTAVLDLFGTNILEVASYIAEYIIKLRDWIQEHTLLIGHIDKIAAILKVFIEGIKGCVDAFLSLEIVQKAIAKITGKLSKVFGGLKDGINGINLENFCEWLKTAMNRLQDWIKSLDDSETAKNIIDGLVNGLISGTGAVVEAIMGLGKALIDAFCSLLGIHSPSKVFYAFGAFIILGLIGGLTDEEGALFSAIGDLGKNIIDMFGAAITKGFPNLLKTIANIGTTIVGGIRDFFSGETSVEEITSAIKSIATRIAETIGKIDFGKIFAVALGAGMLFTINKIVDVIKVFGDAFEGFSKLFSGLGKMFGGVGELFNAQAKTMKSVTVLNIAKAIGILAVSLALLASIKIDKLWGAFKVLASLVALMTVLTYVAGKMGEGDITMSFAKAALGILGIGAALLIMAGAMKIIASIDPNQLENVWASLIVMAASLSLVVMTFGKFVRGKAAANIGKVGALLLGMSIALLIMVTVIKRISELSGEDIGKGLGVILGVGVIFTAIIAVSKIAGEHAAKAGGMLLMMSGALLIMTSVIKRFGDLSGSEIAKGLFVVAAIEALFAGFMALSFFAGPNIAKAGIAMLAMSAALWVVVGVIKMVAKLDSGAILKGIGVIAALEVLFAGLIAASLFAGQHAIKAGLMLLLMSGALVILSGVLFIISQLDPSGLGRSLAVLSVLEILFGGLIAVTHLAKDIDKATLITMTVTIGILVAALAGLSFIEPKALLSSAGAITSVLLAYAGVMAATGKMKTGKKVIANILTLTLVTAALGGIIIALTKIGDPSGAIQAASGLSILLLSLAGTLAILGKVKIKKIGKTLGTEIAAMVGVIAVLAVILGLMSKFDVEGSVKSATALGILLNALSASLVILGYVKIPPAGAIPALYTLSGVVAILAVILGAMSKFNVEASIPNVIALSILMAAMSGVLVILSTIGAASSTALMGVLALTAMAIPLLALVGVLALMQNVQNALANVGVLTLLATAMTLLLIPLAIIGSFAPTALMGVLALTAMAIPLLALVGVLALMQNVQVATDNVDSLIKLMTAMTLLLIPLSLVGALAVPAIIGVGVLLGFITALGGFIAAVGWITEKVPALEEFINKGIPILEKIGYAIGSFAGNLISGFTDSVASSLSTLGTGLSEFMTNATPFINGVKMVDESAITGVKALVGAIVALTAADFISGIASFSPFSSGLAQLGTDLSNFLRNALPFIAGIRLIDPSTAEGVKSLAEALLVLTAADFISGISNFITGGTSLTDFGNQLKPFGEALAGYAATVSTIDEAGLEAMKVSAKAGKTLAEMAESIPNSGGLLGKLFGENDAGDFGTQLESFGKALVAYSKAVVDLQIGAIEASVPAAQSLVKIADSIPNSDGLFGFLAGDNNIGDFGVSLASFGSALKGYGIAVTGLAVDAIDVSVTAAESIVKLSKKIPESGGLLDMFSGHDDLGTFGVSLASFGSALKGYGIAVTGLAVDAITQSITAAQALNKIANNLPETGTGENNMEKFGKKLVKFAESMKKYGDKVADIDTSSLSSATSEFVKIAKMATSVSDVNFEGISSLGTSLGKIGKEGVTSFVKAFTGSTDKVKDAGAKMVTSLLNGVNSKSKTLSTAFGKVVASSVTAIRDKYQSFYSAGSYLVSGFASGISANTWKAEAKARAMANAAEKAAKEALDINSPSKVFRAIGYSVPEGFAMGIDRLAGMVVKSSTLMGDDAIQAVGKSISRISDVLNADIDSQPTIRPVVDLSDVKTSASAIGSIFNMTPSVGVLSNVRGINYSMSQYRQNGDNSDVVSAIDNLRKDLGNIGGTTYTVNGITYDDGSNIADAVRSLTRAAIVERRI